MNRGFYAATSAMMADIHRHDTVANNLANANTTGFKKQLTVHHNFRRQFLERIQYSESQSSNHSAPLEMGRPVGALGIGTLVQSTHTSHESGPLKETGNPFDLALRGAGFFVVQTPAGERYTRNGSFTLNAERELVTSEGYRVLGEQGPLSLPEGKISITVEGRITSGQETLGQLKLVDFVNESRLVHEGQNFFKASEGMLKMPVEAEVAQQTLEMSNVNLSSEMVNMITALRSYQINQKALQSEDEMTGKVINEIGRPV